MSDDDPNNRRLLPAVDRVLNTADIVSLCQRHGRSVVTDWVRDVLKTMRNGQLRDPDVDSSQIMSEVVLCVQEVAQRLELQRLRQAINGTGVVIHTNLGRAPLPRSAVQAVAAVASGTNLELDLMTGNRGRRGSAVDLLCQQVTGAEGALVVNNCAAATLLALQTVAAGRRVVISRGQLIEIGGSFRLPDVFRQAGVILDEVGTTNRTRLADYAAAIGSETAALMRVHPSNYRITGFSESVAIADLANLARERGLPVIDDVGSGCLYDLSPYGLTEEPVIANSLRAGADLVLFSGDKLLGGPQCGIIVGRTDLIEKLRRNPLSRALRVDKMTLAALQATLEIHQAGRAFAEIPVLRQLSQTADEIRIRADRLMERLHASANVLKDCFALQRVESAPGGGALADQLIPSWAIAISVPNPEQVAQRLRLGTPAVVSRIHEGRNIIDLRTVLEEDEQALITRILDSVG